MNEKLMTALYQKVSYEQCRFRDWLLTQSQEEVLNHACEYSIRENIVMELERMELSEKQAQALLKAPDTLADIYKAWQKRDSCDHMEDVANTIANCADEMLQAEQERRKADKER
ncbi:MAG: DUF3848 domain-containing protein [Oscillospiraceae bacterium]|nr:DUF3848 domain-containing protein [Oscillospiraceae bacterium]